MYDLLTFASAGMLGAVGYTHVQLRRGIRRPPVADGERTGYPSLTVIRPIRGLDVGARENLEALLHADYPGELEILFVLDDDEDDAYPLVQEVASAYRGRARTAVLLAGPPPPGRTGKLHAMIVGVTHARGELIGFSDSDTRPSSALVRLLVDKLLGDPRAGDVFAPAVVSNAPDTPGDVGYCLMLNGWYGSAAASCAGPEGELPFIMGQLMVFRREAIEAIGGLSCADGQLTDDMYIGRCVTRAGWRNLMADHPLTIYARGMSLGDFIRLERRWILFSRNGLPASFTRPHWFRGVEFFVATLLIVLAVGSSAWAPAALASAAILGSGASQIALHRAMGGARVPMKFAWVPFVLMLTAPAIVLSTVVDKSVAWRGRGYQLDLEARLVPDEEPEEEPSPAPVPADV
jgi:ceramide glucosyltransferase